MSFMKSIYADDDIIIRIPRKLYNKRVQNILSHLEHIKVVSNSKATEKEISEFLTYVGRERGKMMKKFIKERGLLKKL